MSDVKISALTTGTPLGSDEIPAVDTVAGETKKYIRSDVLNYFLNAQGLTTYSAAKVATTAELTVVYDNGTAGVGATLTNGDVQAALTIDGVALAVDDRVVVKDQPSTFQNGIYTVTNIGSGATNWVMTRATDYDEPAEIIQYAIVSTTEGTANAGLLWQETGAGPWTIGTTAIVFAQYLAATAGGATSEVQWNNAGLLDGISTLTTDGTDLALAGGSLLIDPPVGSPAIDASSGDDFTGSTSTDYAVNPAALQFGNVGNCDYPTAAFALAANVSGAFIAGTSQTLNSFAARATSAYFASIYGYNDTNDVSAFQLYGMVTKALWNSTSTAGTMVSANHETLYDGQDNAALTAVEIGGIKSTVSLAPLTSTTQTTATAYGSLSVFEKTTASTNTNTCNLTAAGAVASLINIDNDGAATNTNITSLSLFGSGGVFLTATGAASTMTVTNYFGLYLPSITSGGTVTVTNRFGIYQEDAAATNSLAGPTSAYSLAFTNTAGLIGTTTNDNADAGSVGELLSSVILVGSAVSLTTATAANITSLALTAGDWDVWAELWTSPDGTTTTSRVQVAISGTTATLPTVPATGTALTNIGGISVPAGEAMTASTSQARVSLGSTTTYYMVAEVDFAVSTLSGYGVMYARRRR